MDQPLSEAGSKTALTLRQCQRLQGWINSKIGQIYICTVAPSKQVKATSAANSVEIEVKSEQATTNPKMNQISQHLLSSRTLPQPAAMLRSTSLAGLKDVRKVWNVGAEGGFTRWGVIRRSVFTVHFSDVRVIFLGGWTYVFNCFCHIRL